jgi:hypothetical protein
MRERRPLLRRVAYLAALTTACAAFVFSLAGIAGTKGQVKPGGHAAALARQLQVQSGHGCRHHRHPVSLPTGQPEV